MASPEHCKAHAHANRNSKDTHSQKRPAPGKTPLRPATAMVRGTRKTGPLAQPQHQKQGEQGERGRKVTHGRYASLASSGTSWPETPPASSKKNQSTHCTKIPIQAIFREGTEQDISPSGTAGRNPSGGGPTKQRAGSRQALFRTWLRLRNP